MAPDFLVSLFNDTQMPISTAIFILIASITLRIIESAISKYGLPGWRNAVERDISICVSLINLEQKLGNKASGAESAAIGRLYDDALRRLNKSQQKKKRLKLFLTRFSP